MKRTLFIFALFFSMGLTANDSLKTREKKWIFTVNGNATLFNQPLFSRHQKFTITEWYGARFKAMYLIPGTPKKNLGAGINGSFSSFLFNDVLVPPGFLDPYSGYGTAFFYDPEKVSIRNYNGNIGIFFSLYGMYEGLYFSHISVFASLFLLRMKEILNIRKQPLLQQRLIPRIPLHLVILRDITIIKSFRPRSLKKNIPSITA